MGCEASACRMPLDDSSHSLGSSQLELLYEWPTDWEVQTTEYLCSPRLWVLDEMTVLACLISSESFHPDLKMASSS